MVPLGLYSQAPNEILGRITDHSVTASVMPDKTSDIYIEYGTVTGVYPKQTTTINTAAGVPALFLLDGLPPDTRCYYRTRYKPSGSGSFSTGTERSFHTRRPTGSTFTFTLESDEHMYDKKGVNSIYQVCLNNQAADQPDFMISMGDNFGDDHNPFSLTSNDLKELHRQYRPFLGTICHSVPLFLGLGNHEGENNYYLGFTPPENLAVYATRWRKYYYPNPFPDDFYTGNTEQEPYDIGYPENYYAWTWGEALFVVLDAYRYQCDTSAKPKNWEWTLGKTQYDWLKSTLEGSTSKYKLVFIHQLRGQGRGGAILARFFEWGGYEGNGSGNTFAANRPGWDKPIHQLLKDNGVNILFHGHDHLFAHEVYDGVVYQEIPMPSDSTYEIGMLANADAYISDTIPGTGHLRVTVDPQCVRVDFVRAWLPADTVSGQHHNREIGFSYSLGDCPHWDVAEQTYIPEIRVFPNPAADVIKIELRGNRPVREVKLLDIESKPVMIGHSNLMDVSRVPPGIYILAVEANDQVFRQKITIIR